MKKVFYITFHGHFLGGYAIVVSTTSDGAWKILEKRLKDEFPNRALYQKKDVSIKEISPINSGIVEFYNGDY